MKTDLLASRHIGINEEDTAVMLRKIGVDSLDELINKTIPANIRLEGTAGTGQAVDGIRIWKTHCRPGK